MPSADTLKRLVLDVWAGGSVGSDEVVDSNPLRRRLTAVASTWAIHVGAAHSSWSASTYTHASEHSAEAESLRLLVIPRRFSKILAYSAQGRATDSIDDRCGRRDGETGLCRGQSKSVTRDCARHQRAKVYYEARLWRPTAAFRMPRERVTGPQDFENVVRRIPGDRLAKDCRLESRMAVRMLNGKQRDVLTLGFSKRVTRNE